MPRQLSCRALVWPLLVALLTVPAYGYRVIFKDGSTLAALERYQVEGDVAVITLVSGTKTSVPLAEIDVARTEEFNQREYGTAIVIEGRNERPLDLEETEARAARTLRDLIIERQRQRGEQPAEKETTPKRRPVRTTPAGYPDLASLQRLPVEPADMGSLLEETLREKGLSRFLLFAGTDSGRYLIEGTTDSQIAVFEALEAATAALVELQESGVAIEAFEVLLRTSHREPAGMFTLTAHNAALLAKKRIEPGEFFLQFVEF